MMPPLVGALAMLLAREPSGLSRGVWLSADGPQQYALEFEHTGPVLSGPMHVLREGKLVFQRGFAGTGKESGELEPSWGSSNSSTAAETSGFAAQPELPYRLLPPARSSGWEVAESTEPLVATEREVQKSGYLWWRLDAPLEAGRYPVIVASGWGSQFIHIVPALEAVIVTTGGNQMNGKDYAIGRVLLRHLVPGVDRWSVGSADRNPVTLSPRS